MAGQTPATRKPHLCWFCNQGIEGTEDLFSAVWVEYPDFDIPRLASVVVLVKNTRDKEGQLTSSLGSAPRFLPGERQFFLVAKCVLMGAMLLNN